MAGHADSHSHGNQVGHHVPMWVLVATLLTLLVLTVLTVTATWVDLGHSVNLAIALGIATIKAILVALFFMHLAYDRPFNAIVLISALLFVMVFVGVALQDSLDYRGAIDEYRQVDPVRYAPAMNQEPAPGS
jgi:cytochrome c oxidase subunit IV